MIRKLKTKFPAYYKKYMYFIGVAGHSLFIFQALKVLATRTTQGVSLTGFIISLLSVVSWFFYGLMQKDRVLTIISLVGSVAASICVAVIMMVQ